MRFCLPRSQPRYLTHNRLIIQTALLANNAFGQSCRKVVC